MKQNNEKYYISEGRNKNVNRSQGLLSLTLGSIFAGAGLAEDSTLLTTGGGIFLIDGAGDLITGYHHYALVKTSEYLEEGIKKIRKTI